jgi:hypothetical protein
MSCFAQTTNNSNLKVIANDSLQKSYDANRPARAAFYSAVVPGLGQVYNKKYWKVPIVYAALGTGIAVYSWNDNQYQELRSAFRIRLAGGTDDVFSNPDGTPIISNQGLERAQKQAQRNKELSLLITAGLYILQIIDANVDGHLSDFNVDGDLSLSPTFINDPQGFSNFQPGLSLTYSF